MRHGQVDPPARGARAPGGARGRHHHRRHDRLVRPVPRPAPLLRLVPGPRPSVVAVDVPGRGRARADRHLVRAQAGCRHQEGPFGIGRLTPAGDPGRVGVRAKAT
ncbi:hypothetical protein SGPA1_50708 [Streptomyces misionensis JCM 4497]